MRIGVIGLRGFPHVQGGIETHCENLYPLIARKDHQFYIFRRKAYVKSGNTSYPNITFIDISAPRNRYLENIVHTCRSIWRSRKLGIRILHLHGIGPSILIPFAKLLGMKVIVTHHGKDYNRKKWGRFAKYLLKKGEKTAFRKADRIIAVNGFIKEQAPGSAVKEKIIVIPNGIKPTSSPVPVLNILEDYSIEKNRFLLAVGRLVEEKGFHNLIRAFEQADIPEDIKLVIAGSEDFKDRYSARLKMNASKRIVFTGAIHKDKLAVLYDNAAVFALPSYHEGLSIALLEAMSQNLPVIVSDIPANRIPQLDESVFFNVDDLDTLKTKIEKSFACKPEKKAYDLDTYDWDKVAQCTEEVYRYIEQELQ